MALWIFGSSSAQDSAAHCSKIAVGSAMAQWIFSSSGEEDSHSWLKFFLMLSAAIKINNLAILLKLAMPMAEWILVAAHVRGT